MHVENAGTNLSLWRVVHTNKKRLIDGVLCSDFYSQTHEAIISGEKWLMSRFYLRGSEVFRAWGSAIDKHCSFHAYVVDGQLSGSYVGCPDVRIDLETSELVLHTNKRYTVTILKHA